MLILESLDLVALESEKRRFQSREKRRAGDQETDREKKERKPDCRHPLPRPGAARPSERMCARLPVITAAPKISFP